MSFNEKLKAAFFSTLIYFVFISLIFASFSLFLFQTQLNLEFYFLIFTMSVSYGTGIFNGIGLDDN